MMSGVFSLVVLETPRGSQGGLNVYLREMHARSIADVKNCRLGKLFGLRV